MSRQSSRDATLLLKRTYGAIRWTGESWEITECEPHVAIRLKQLFPSIAKHKATPFVLTGGPSLDADLAWVLSRYPLKISEPDAERMAGRKTLFETQQTELAAILAPGWMPSKVVGFRGNQRPWNYQSQAAELARRTGRLLIGDEMGLGKTVSAIAAIVAPQYLPALVVPQTHLPDQWAEEIRDFTTLKTHVIKKTLPYELPPADVYICPYSKISGWVDYAATSGIKAVVFDEIQELRNGKSTAKGTAAWQFARQAQLVIGLSGTPIYNYGDELWQIINLLDPGALGSWEDFLREWCTGRQVNDPPALGTFLREQHLFLRRTRADVGDERKYSNIISQPIPYNHDALKVDEALMIELAQRVTSGGFQESGMAAREFDLKLRQQTGIAKAPHVAAFVKILLAAKQPVVLCGWHRDVYDIWLRELAEFNPVLYTGSESAAQKKKNVKAFTSGASDLFIMSLRSGAGLNGLQARSHTIVFGELDWSPKVHEQCVARLDRPGQKHQVDAIYLHANGGSDPAMIGVLGVKASQSHGIIDPNRDPIAQLSDGTRIRQLAELYLQGKSALAAPAPVAPIENTADPEQPFMF